MDDGTFQSAISAANTAAMASMTIEHGQEAAQVQAVPGAEMSHTAGQGMGYMRHMDRPCQDPA